MGFTTDIFRHEALLSPALSGADFLTPGRDSEFLGLLVSLYPPKGNGSVGVIVTLPRIVTRSFLVAQSSRDGCRRLGSTEVGRRSAGSGCAAPKPHLPYEQDLSTGTHDDQVDTTTAALARLTQRATVRSVEIVYADQEGRTPYPKGSMRERFLKKQRSPARRHGPARGG